jgi:CRISPR-associated protein Csm5
MNTILKISLEVLTPIHISSGKEIPSHEYIIKNNRFYRFNLNKFVKQLDTDEKQWFLEKINNRSSLEIRSIIYDFLIERFNTIDFKYEIGIEKIRGDRFKEKVDNLIEDLYFKNLKQDSFQNSNSLNIKEFINVHNKKYIPGSSIKGAIRTALVNESFKNDYYFLEKNKNIPKDYFKNLIVTDSELATDENIEISAINRASKNNFIEVLQPNFKTNFFIKIRDENKFNKENIIKSTNNFYKNNILFYINELNNVNRKLNININKDKERKQEKNKKIIPQFENILETINNFKENEFILNIGFGGGKIFKTVDPEISKTIREFKPNPNKNQRKNKLELGILPIPYTISLINGKIMGWVKCKIIQES